MTYLPQNMLTPQISSANIHAVDFIVSSKSGLQLKLQKKDLN